MKTLFMALTIMIVLVALMGYGDSFKERFGACAVELIRK